jgi:hypothetical protein
MSGSGGSVPSSAIWRTQAGKKRAAWFSRHKGGNDGLKEGGAPTPYSFTRK